MISRASGYLKIIEEIQNGVMTALSKEEQRCRIPDALVLAFEHLVMAFCVLGSRPSKHPDLQESLTRHHTLCQDRLLRGKDQLFLIYAGDQTAVKLYKAVNPEGLAGLIFNRLVNTNKGPARNILSSYQKYMFKLVSFYFVFALPSPSA